MSETATTKPSSKKSLGIAGMITTSLTTFFFTMFAASIFLGVDLGWRSYRQHNVKPALNRIDALLMIKPWLSPPTWITQVQVFYKKVQTTTLEQKAECTKGLSVLSQDFFQFQNASASPDYNPFANQFIQTCSVTKNQILPLLSGVLAVILMRFWVFVTAIPLFWLSLTIGWIDGLAQRDIRKFQGARESSLLFHTFRYSGTTLFFLPLLIYFCWLSPLSPAWFFIPMAIVMGFWLTFSLRFFKKYV